MKRRARLNVTIIGAGKVGTVLGRILVENGCRIICVISRTAASARKTARFVRCPSSATDLASIPPETDLVFITTPHGAVETVARELSQSRTLHFRRLTVCHASGMLTAKVLEPIRERGATVFSFHPLQTFPRDFSPSAILPTARGIYYGVDGRPEGVRMAKRLARLLEGRVIEIPPDLRTFYHAACVVASNHLTTMLAILESMVGTITGKPSEYYRLFKPIMAATLSNVERTTPAQALSGPVARGGVETVKLHFDALARYAPGLIPYFRAVSLETVQLAVRKGSITAGQAVQMSTMIQTFIPGTQTPEKLQ